MDMRPQKAFLYTEDSVARLQAKDLRKVVYKHNSYESSFMDRMTSKRRLQAEDLWKLFLNRIPMKALL